MRRGQQGGVAWADAGEGERRCGADTIAGVVTARTRAGRDEEGETTVMTKSKFFRSAAILGAVVIIGAAVLSAGPTFAAKGGQHGGGQTATSITLNETDPHLGDLVSFSTNAGLRINVTCYQDGAGVVYAADQPVGTVFLLGGTGSLWLSLGGSADCYVWLYTRSLGDGFLAWTTFTAGGAR